MKTYGVSTGRIDVSCYDTDITVILLAGEHDLSTSDGIWRELELAIRAWQAVSIDLSDAEFIDSSVIHQLLNADKLARNKGTRVVLQLETAPVVERVIEVAGVDRHLVIARSRELAIAAARKRGGGDTSR